jgi:hypothetical protein
MRHVQMNRSSLRALALVASAAAGALAFNACGGGCDTDPTKDPAANQAAPSKPDDKAGAATAPAPTPAQPQIQVTKGPLVYGAKCSRLLAGQTIEAGEVCAIVEGNQLNVTYTTKDGWTLTEAHLWADDTLSTMPVNNKGNPVPGQFPYKTGALPEGTTTATLSVPLSVFGLDVSMTTCDPVTAYVAAHAAVKKVNSDGTVQTETGWGEGPRIISKGNWGTFFTLPLGCKSDDPPPPVGCETSFVYQAGKATCFIGSPWIDTSRWGWTNGPFDVGTHNFDVYAAAGQCDLTKGTKVGTASVVYGADGTATVSLAALAGFTFDESHLYVGTEPLPRKNGEYTGAPGQYPLIHDLTNASTDSFTVTGLTGPIYVVFHAVACGASLPAPQ